MKLYATSDLHLFHENAIKYCERPYETWTEMNQTLIDNWNSVVSDEDLCIIVGDLSCGVGAVGATKEDLVSIVKQLKGSKILIRGNHDHYPDSFYIKDCGFLRCEDYLFFEDTFFVHYPIFGDINAEKREETKEIIKQLRKAYENYNCKIIYGHSHSLQLDPEGRHYNVCVDINGYTPVLLKTYK